MKKLRMLIALVLSIILCLPVVFAVSVSANESVLILGDADRDGNVNIKDATLVQKYVAGLEDFYDTQLLTADADEDSVITVKDATTIQKFVAQLSVAHPVGEEIIVESTTETTVPAITEAGTTATETEVTEPDTEATEPDTEKTEPEEKMDTKITIYFSNNVSWDTVNAYFYNEAKGTNNSWPGKAMTYHTTNDFGEKIYKIDVDVSEYNRVIFNNGTSQTMNVYLSVASSGFYIHKNTPKKMMSVGVYAYGEPDYEAYTTVKLDYPDGYKKPVYIWTPLGYDPADTSKEYKIMYLLDGQNQVEPDGFGHGGWASKDIVASLQHNGGEGIIIVGIDNCDNRDSELTPDIGDVVSDYNYGGFKNGTGETFADFVANTVKPYVEANYNVSTAAEDNAVIGSSSGGIEAFYIGMEHMDKFGNIGALSPAFMLFDKSDWDTYLSKFDFTDKEALPRIYFYNGGYDALEKELCPYAEAMPKWLKNLGYPEENLIFSYEANNAHNESAWRAVMPEVIAWLFEL